MKTKKIIIILVAIVIVLVIIAALTKKGGKGTKVSVEKASMHNIVEEVSASGKIYPESEVKISPDVSGEITELYVKEGDTVKQGTLLLKINPELYITTLDQAKASLNTAKANSANSEAQLSRVNASYLQQQKLWERSQKLFKEKVLSQQDYDNAEAQYMMSKADYEASQKAVLSSKYNIESVQANVQQATKSYGRTSIYAPSDGIVTALNSEKGERVVGTSQMAGTEIMRISNLDNMEVRVDVNENDIVRIKLGDTANIEVDAYGNRVFKGIVTLVANSATQSSSLTSTDQVTNFQVKIRILSSSYKDLIKQAAGRIPFKPGMSASVNIITSTESNVLSIPVSAVTVKSSDMEKKKDVSGGDKKTNDTPVDNNAPKDEIVWIVSNGKATMRVVKTGIQDTRYIKVLEGIKEGETVVSFPFDAITYKLKEGTVVEVVDKESLFEMDKK
ncbi:MAG: efflux RND transporter periplasmic adaptor subunit [Bacteroidia bacterium]|nr:efflux RND transporter periplasmic adaptor subunit [Bacteroidia bacterium]